ncbi:hypothetical protein [Halobacillus salinus]|uniref:hypothetical protein n=1 Tax=Halobacillus salinus TaxID=192814 RepID=UPI0009A86D71|nr:hypothetical protein [Halobacillus salinus]
MWKKTASLIVFVAVVLSGCNLEEEQEVVTENWTESEVFTSGTYEMIGEEDQLGFITAGPFQTDQKQKYMWHFWGQEVSGDLKVTAIHESGQEKEMLSGVPLGGPNNGADAHTPSMMSFPEQGMWKLDAFINGTLHGAVYVKVQ